MAPGARGKLHDDMPDLPLTGRCLCGGVRYAISEPLLSAGYCHCTRCQRRIGVGAALSALTVPGSFAITAGEEMLRAWLPPEGGNAKVFCATCGGGVYSHPPGDPSRAAVRFGTLDGDPGIRPAYHQHVASAAVWDEIPGDGLPRFDGAAPSPPR